MTRAKNGSQPVDFGELVRMYAERAYNFAYRLSGNDADARDLVQEAFAHALKHYGRYDQDRPFGPWFNRILKNIFLDSVRKYEKRKVISLDGDSPVEDVSWGQMIPGNDQTPLETLDAAEEQALAQKALDSLPVLYKTALILCDVERRSYDEIAGILGCPLGTVRSRIHQGRLLLRQMFEKLQSDVMQVER